MQIVIEIPDELKKALDNNEEYRLYTESVGHIMLTAIKNGTPLPEHHSELVDKREVYKKFYNRSLAHVAGEILSEVTTIIPATKEGDEK